ncbi:MAG: transposase, partial [Planctomycetales bacterium]|nr:transposase [Planctomycetales bacterium]
APYNCESGTMKGKQAIIGGRRSVRAALYMAALSARKHNPSINAFANRLENQGKPQKLILTACMRKLLTLLNSIVKTKSPWKCPHTA